MVAAHKKVIVIFGGSGPLGKLLFSKYLEDEYVVINISKSRRLPYSGVINIKADITSRLDLLKIQLTLQTLAERVDVLVLGSMFIHHKQLFAMTKKELAHEFDVNVFSQIEVVKLLVRTFWQKDIAQIKKCIYVSSAASLRVTSRQDLESYSLEKSSLNFVAKYFDKELSKCSINSVLYMPGNLENKYIRKQLYDEFWKDVAEEKVRPFKETAFR